MAVWLLEKRYILVDLIHQIEPKNGMVRKEHSAMRLACLLLATAAIGLPQFLYNERLDKKSQDAVTAAKAVSSGALFDKELQNLDRLWKFSSARVFQGAELQMSTDLSGFFDWQQVVAVIERTRYKSAKGGNSRNPSRPP